MINSSLSLMLLGLFLSSFLLPVVSGFTKPTIFHQHQQQSFSIAHNYNHHLPLTQQSMISTHPSPASTQLHYSSQNFWLAGLLPTVEDIPLSAVSVVVLIGAAATALWISGADERAQKAQQIEWQAKADEIMAERARKAYIEPRTEPWTIEELKRYDGTKDNEEGPILIGVNGKVYNVWKSRHLYGPGCEYAIFAGRDATRLLAKFQTTEETEESKQKPLTVAEKATLQGYIWTFNDKYEVVGALEEES